MDAGFLNGCKTKWFRQKILKEKVVGSGGKRDELEESIPCPTSPRYTYLYVTKWIDR